MIRPFVKCVAEATEKIASCFVMAVMKGKDSLPLKNVFIVKP